MDTCISMESVGIPNPSTRGHIPHMFFIHSCRTPMPHSHSHVLACQPHSLAMMCEAWFPPLELRLSHSVIPYMFPAEACGFPWAKNITTTGCSSDIPPMLCHSRHASQRGTGFFLQPKNSTISYKCQHKLFHLQSPECSHHGWTLHGLPFSQPAVCLLTRV